MERIILFLRAAIMFSVLSLIGYFAIEYAPIFEKVKPTVSRLVTPLSTWWEGVAWGSKATTSGTQAEGQTKGQAKELSEPELFRPGGPLGSTRDFAEASVAEPFSSVGSLGQKIQREPRQVVSSGFDQIASASFQDVKAGAAIKAEPRSFNKSFNTTQPRPRSFNKSFNTTQPRPRSFNKSFNTTQPRPRSFNKSFNTTQPRLSMIERAQLQITEAKPFGLRPASQLPVAASPVANRAKVTAGTLQADTQLQQHLAELRKRGAVKYDLKPWGRDAGDFRFKCDVAIGENHDHTRLFEATGPVPVELVTRVLREVQVWRTEQAGRTIRRSR